MAVTTPVGSQHSTNRSSTLANRTSTATLSGTSQHKNSSTPVVVPSSIYSDTSSVTLIDDTTAILPRNDQQHLTEANLLQQQRRYNEAAVVLDEEARIQRLQEVGSKLGFDLPLHHYGKDKGKRSEWLEERATSVNRH
ncbi:hypothetical protein CFE70_006711 [Pyrenophora teres f. teres 0-1]|uniref:Uncharacterized protein n=2 Tax=Pyrenophora teres f. teres TaxID=97479 RepID=E3RT66_PYRTT|nr:hypothetical protein PTT_12173 [Pyrenophora teres f. teres 0-1]KAK1919117.1 hypothetical protein P3342_008841 [Pyrenophora teres f. teres]CAE7187912.1 hypothetical protein PTTW11_07233 [Pyrenophora teres f. teres]